MFDARALLLKLCKETTMGEGFWGWFFLEELTRFDKRQVTTEEASEYAQKHTQDWPMAILDSASMYRTLHSHTSPVVSKRFRLRFGCCTNH